MREESGLEIGVVEPISVFHIFRGARVADNELIGVVYWCRTEEDGVVLSPEHSAFRWTPVDEALALVAEPGIRDDINAFVKARDRR